MCLRTWHSRAHACAQIERERKKENKKSNNSNKTKPPLHDSVAKAIAQASQLTQHARTRARQHTHLPRGEGETSDNKNCTKKQVPTPESEPQTHPSLHSPTFLVCQTCTHTAPVSLALVTDQSSHHRHNHNYRHPSCPHVLGIPPPLSCPLARAVITHSNRARKRPDWLPYLLGREFRSETSMDSFTQESDESSSCTQSDEDSTNSSSGTNPFFLCPRGTTLQISGQSRLQDATEDPGKLKYARMDPYGYHQYRASAIANPVGISNLPFSHNAIGAIHGSDGLRGSPLFLQSRSYVPSSLEDCRGLAAQVTSSARPPRPYLGLQPQGYSLGHETTGNTPSSTMLLSENCKLDKMSGNLGKTSGNFLLGLADPQPGRCRRTDGKKWRCGRAVVPEQKYCERHMHRGRGRSKAAKLARFSGGVDMNRLHNTERHPNPPYIELLNHLSVPAEPFSQPLGVAQHSSVSAQALMVPETTQSLQQEYVHAPNFMQHAVAESSEQLVTGSNVIDSPTNQSPMQAEPLNLLQSNGRLPVLAQAIPMNEVTKVKFRHDPVNESVTDEARVTIQDPNDILSLDVQAIKQLLENAPCSMRPRNSMNRQQQLLNVADLLNVAHIRNLHSQPKKPPPLMDILRMVNPATASNTSLNSISLIDHQSKSMIDDNQIAHNDHYAQVVMDSSGARDDRTVLSLACTDKALENQNSQYRLNKVSAVSSSSRMQSEGKMLPMSIEFDTQGGEGYDQDKQVAGRFRRYSEGECIESMTKDDSAGPLSDLTEGCGNRLENISYRASEVANGSHSGLHSLVEKDKDCFRSSNNSNRQNLAEESSRCRSIENLKSIRSDVKHSTAAQESNKQYKSSTSVEEKGNPSSKNGVINFQEKYMKSESCNVIFLEEERSDTCSSSSSEKTLDEHGDSGATEMISPIAKKRMDKKENFVNLDMNRPILDVEDMSQHGDNGLRRLSATSMLGVVSAFEQSSSEVESFNRNGFPKSTLTLEPVPLSNPEQTTQISLVN